MRFDDQAYMQTLYIASAPLYSSFHVHFKKYLKTFAKFALSNLYNSIR